MRIAHYFFRVSEASGGVSRAIYDLVRKTAAAGHDVSLLTGSDSQFPDDWEQTGKAVSLDLLPPPVGLLQRLQRAALERVSHRLDRVDLLHLHGLWRPSTSQVAELAREKGIPYVLTPHGTLDEWSMRRHALRKRVYYRLFERKNLTAARMVHCTAQAEVEQSQRWIPHKRIRAIPYVVDLAPYRDLPGPDLFLSQNPGLDGRPAVLFLSRLHPKKGAEALIEAMGHLHQQGIDCQLWFAGSGEPGYVRHLQRLADRWVSEAHFLGLVTGRVKLSLYRAASLLALPTHQENFGLVLPESLACGTPVVTTRGTDIWRELEESGGARIVGRTPVAFAEALADLLANPSERQRMGQAGRQWIFDWLDPTRVMGQFEDLYRAAM